MAKIMLPIPFTELIGEPLLGLPCFSFDVAYKAFNYARRLIPTLRITCSCVEEYWLGSTHRALDD